MGGGSSFWLISYIPVLPLRPPFSPALCMRLYCDTSAKKAASPSPQTTTLIAELYKASPAKTAKAAKGKPATKVAAAAPKPGFCAIM